ncbi:general L-amino acid transport system permease protein [Litoreibacter ponti]|uniref:General L-amino acid transport system permease protein n=1 Tax=Litoreibacter ponti TaxID=1510457 RepID=A0A2T6BM84_9RHOB|nr:amino acid ABC transporter permease [Litoreibacter ponti]PTX57190.1 general L-amino acid transport system permease protein [Litoreibacter ponti]
MSDTHAQTVAFVRETEIPPAPPPASQAGAVKWVRENLFSGPFNTIMTLLALYFIYKIFMGAFPWFANGVWDAGSIRECRDKVTASGAETGACFAVLVDRWDHLMFGFKYPADAYWRPLVAFLVMLVAIAPVLFSKVFPRKMLILTALYPFLAFWLIWGGSLWVPLTILAAIIVTGMIFKFVESLDVGARTILAAVVGAGAGAGLAYLLFTGAQELWFIAGSIGNATILTLISSTLFMALSVFTYAMFIPMGIFVGYAIYNDAEDGGLVTIVTSLAAIYVMLAYLLGPVSGTLNSIIPIELQAVPSRDMGGYMLCMILGVVCVSLSIPLGIILALGRQSNMPLIKGVCVVFIEFIRGVPLITLLFVANVMLAYFMPPESNFDLILRVIIMITMFSSAYIAEVIRGGLAALPKGQYEAADSLGLNYTQATRLIILPQALKISIPGIVNVAVGLFKDTTLVSVISMFDIVGMIRGPIQQSTDWISIYWEVYLFAALVFFVVCYSISQYSQWLERQLNTSHR